MRNNPKGKILNYRVSGEGRPVLFLHGFLESMLMWDKVIPEGIQAVLVDLPGHGSSMLQDYPYETLEEVALMVSELVTELEISAFDVVGHSMGGYVALEVLHGDSRCQRLVLLNSNTWTDDPQKQKDRHRVAELVKHSKKHFLYEAIPHLFWHPEQFPEEVRALLDEAALMEPEAIGAAALAMSRRRDHTQTALDAGNEVLIFQGVEDTVVPADRMRATGLPETAVYIELESCGHMGHIERRDETLKHMTEFLG